MSYWGKGTAMWVRATHRIHDRDMGLSSPLESRRCFEELLVRVLGSGLRPSSYPTGWQVHHSPCTSLTPALTTCMLIDILALQGASLTGSLTRFWRSPWSGLRRLGQWTR